MKLDELLKHQSLVLPKNWKSLGHPSYYSCVVNEGEKFLNLLEELDDSEIHGKDDYLGALTKKRLISIAKDFYLMTLTTLQRYFNKGNPHETYNKLDERLKKSNGMDNKPLLCYLDFAPLYPQHYRLRKKEGKVGLGDLFHVPFELRHNISSDRYSIAGYPTLYFSNSVFLAYKELEEPDYDNLYVSKFYHTQYYNEIETLLDMTSKPMEDTVEYKFKYLARWILIMACNVKVGFPNSPFKSEYILPQIIFQWIKNNINIGPRKVIGVKYSSTKIIDSGKGFVGYFYNTAIPIHHSNKEGYCDVLTKQFCMTQPMSFHKALELESEDVSLQGQVKSIEAYGVPIEYIRTDFGRIEQVLSNTPQSDFYYVNGKKA